MNTFAEYTSEVDLITFPGWTGNVVSQIDFVAAPLSLQCASSLVDSDMHFSTNHRPVVAVLTSEETKPRLRQSCIRN